jgi:hypothetical protein
MVTPRAHIEVVGVGVVEAHPFFRTHLAAADWPDGTHHAALRPHAWKIWNIERSAQSGWVAWSSYRPYAPIALDEREPIRLGGVAFKLRPSSEPLAIARMHVRDLAIIDTAWPLSMEAPRRLAVHEGHLVELQATPAQNAPPEPALDTFVIGAWRWSALPAVFSVPLRWLVDAGVSSPVPAREVDAWDVALDGTLRRVALGTYGLLSPRDAQVALGEPLFPGVVEGFFPERVREWRALEEEVALWPRSPSPELG